MFAHAQQLFSAAIAAVEPRGQVGRHLIAAPSRPAARTFILAIGKAAVPMALGALDVCPRAAWAIALRPAGYGVGGARSEVEVLEGDHPIASAASVAATATVLGRLRASRLTVDDLVLVLISGGASALLVAPAPPLTLEDLAATSALLLGESVPITDINLVRRHLSSVKGGGLLRHLQPAAVRTLVISDVIGDDPLTIGSGPTTHDPTTAADALAALQRRGLDARVPAPVLAHLRSSAEPPAHTHHRAEVIASGLTAAAAVLAVAPTLGYAPRLLSATMEGTAREVGAALAAAIRDYRPGAPWLGVLTGETTVSLAPDPGIGGRNLELALAAAKVLHGHQGCALASLATDGADGAAPTSGAWVDGGTLDMTDLDPDDALARNDAWTFFVAAGGLIGDGPTGTNVGDLVLLFRW